GAILHSVENIDTFDKNKDKTYYVYCKSGNRSAKASEYLAKQGYDVVNLDGGYTAYENQNMNHDDVVEDGNKAIKPSRKQFNFNSLQSSGLIVNYRKEIQNIEKRYQKEVTVTDTGFHRDIKSWTKQAGHSLFKKEENHDGIKASLQKEKLKELEVNHAAQGTT